MIIHLWPRVVICLSGPPHRKLRGKRLLKNEFILFLRFSRMAGFPYCLQQRRPQLQHNIWAKRCGLNGNEDDSPFSMPVFRPRKFWCFHFVVLQRIARNVNDLKGACWSIIYSITPLFSHVLIAVVVVCFRTPPGKVIPVTVAVLPIFSYYFLQRTPFQGRFIGSSLFLESIDDQTTEGNLSTCCWCYRLLS